MSRATRVLVALAAFSMAVVYVLPLWHIGLEAPQYPEGLGLYICGRQDRRGEAPRT